MASPDLIKEVSHILARPLVFELYGAGFTRRRGSSFYELRFPRVSAVHEVRQASEAVTLSELQKTAIEASSWIGSEAESEIDDLWSRHSSTTSGGEVSGDSDDWRSRQEKHWIKKLSRSCRRRSRAKFSQNQVGNEGVMRSGEGDVAGMEDARWSWARSATPDGTSPGRPSVDVRKVSASAPSLRLDVPLLWTCIPHGLASLVEMPQAYHVSSLESLLFAFSKLRRKRRVAQAVVFVDESYLDGVTRYLNTLEHRFTCDRREPDRCQIWLYAVQKAPRAAALSVATLETGRMCQFVANS